MSRNATRYKADPKRRTNSDFGKRPVFKTKQPTVGSNGNNRLEFGIRLP